MGPFGGYKFRRIHTFEFNQSEQFPYIPLQMEHVVHFLWLQAILFNVLTAEEIAFQQYALFSEFVCCRIINVECISFQETFQAAMIIVQHFL